MTDPADLTAICAHVLIRARHRHAQASHGLAVAEQTVREAGLDPAALDRAIALIAMDPHVLEVEQRETARLLVAMRAPGVEYETVEVLERRTDEPGEQRTQRIWRRGWIAAVLNKPAEAPAGKEGAVWMEGFNAFRSALRAFETRRDRKPRARQAVAA